MESTKTRSEDPQGDQEIAQQPVPRSAVVARRGIKTGNDFANLMSALMSDVLEGTVTPNVTNAAVNAGGKLLKMVEMQYRYGAPRSTPQRSPLILAHDINEEEDQSMLLIDGVQGS